ncbi:MAG: M56 family metallopeptidase [Planctomycetota bacterium]|jgi:beta-lactamase regulating signal transducer with metallopeptidase domain
MESFFAQLSDIFGWLLRTSAYAGVLVCLVLVVKAAAGGRLAARWHYLFWLLVIVRMIMPWLPQSTVSVLNMIPESAEWGARTILSTEVGGKEFDMDPVVITPMDTDLSAGPVLRVADMLALVWLAGVLVLAGYVFVSNFRLWRIIKSVRPLTEQRILDLLEDCKKQTGVETILGIIVTDRVKSPALFGFVRPRLLLPVGVIETHSVKELRHIFLHELSHLKRCDILLGWVTTLLLVIHWFNPLVWYAFYRMRQDRELACDASALSTMGIGESEKYGMTIVRLLEKFSQARSLPIIAAVSEDKSNLKKRIAMISEFKKEPYVWSVLAVTLIIVLSFVTLTNAKQRVLVPPTRENLLSVLGQGLSYRREAKLHEGIDDYTDASVIFLETMKKIDSASEQEMVAYKALEDLLESGDYGALDSNDIITAQQKIRAAILYSEQLKAGLGDSSEELEDALKALGIDKK